MSLNLVVQQAPDFQKENALASSWLKASEKHLKLTACHECSKAWAVPFNICAEFEIRNVWIRYRLVMDSARYYQIKLSCAECQAMHLLKFYW